MDDFDITSLEFCPLYCNNLASTSEDGLLGLMDIHSEIEDDYIVLNIEEAGLRVGHLGLDVFTITMGAFQKWNVSQEDPNATPTKSADVTLTQLGIVDYFINAFDLNGVHAYAAGTHTGQLVINTADNISLLQGPDLHSETIREVKAYNGAIITGGEDGRIVVSTPV